MKIESVKVVDLFDYYCYEIEMKKHNPISIIHAPNGFGKTTVFKMIRNILTLDVVEINEVPFKEFTMRLSGNIYIRVSKETEQHDSHPLISYGMLRIEYKNGRKSSIFIELPMTPRIIETIREDGLEEFIHRTEMRRRRIPAEERGEESYNLTKTYEKLNEELEMVRNKLDINFIDSNRLYAHSRRDNIRRGIRNNLRPESRRYREDGISYIEERSLDETNENILRDAKDINERILAVRQQYSLEAEKLDRNFPDRLVEFVESTKVAFTDEQIVEGLAELEKKRIELENAGLVFTRKKVSFIDCSER